MKKLIILTLFLTILLLSGCSSEILDNSNKSINENIKTIIQNQEIINENIKNINENINILNENLKIINNNLNKECVNNDINKSEV